MFNLIITIISIALVAVLAIATIYYGGSAFTEGSAKAKASTLVAHAQQITAANTLYANANGGTATTDISGTLVSSYLTSAPKSPDAAAYTVTTSNDVSAVMSANTSKVCEEVNKSVGLADADLDTDGFQFPATAAGVTTQYGCWDDAGALTFLYKG